MHYLLPMPKLGSTCLAVVGTLSTAQIYMMTLAATTPLSYCGIITGFGGLIGWMNHFSSWIERRKALAQIYLVKHPNNSEYSEDLILVTAKGEELQGKVKELEV